MPNASKKMFSECTTKRKYPDTNMDVGMAQCDIVLVDVSRDRRLEPGRFDRIVLMCIYIYIYIYICRYVERERESVYIKIKSDDINIRTHQIECKGSE